MVADVVEVDVGLVVQEIEILKAERVAVTAVVTTVKEGRDGVTGTERVDPLVLVTETERADPLVLVTEREEEVEDGEATEIGMGEAFVVEMRVEMEALGLVVARPPPLPLIFPRFQIVKLTHAQKE